MSRVMHDLCVAVGKYNDSKGQEKTRWQKVGVVLETVNGGRVILLERWFNPAGIPDPESRGTVMLSMFDPKDTRGGQQGETVARPEPPAEDSKPFIDDIPF